ncbi:MAG TPA: Gfo/Idh/MocA family oxidoreductase [Firmicutes bacterium]|nr:Gfo/Idh/MocA family oxidoreductase [Bacillota bacterium]
MSDQVKVGIIGIGGLARSVHLPALSQIKTARIEAVCDIIEERARKAAEQYGIPKVYTLYKEMIAKEKLDAIFCIVQPDQLYRIVLDCLMAGLDVFMEKPPGITAFQAESLQFFAEKNNRILQVGFNRRYIPVVQKTLEIMRELTPITHVEGTFLKHGTASFCQGALSAFPSDTIHCVDLVRWIAGGKPVKAATVTGQVNDVVKNAWFSVIKFDNDCLGIVRANYMTGGRTHAFEIHGPQASAFINLGMGENMVKSHIMVHGGKTSYSISSTGTQAQKYIDLDGFELAGSTELHRYYGFYQEDEAFLDCVLNRKKPLADISEGAASMRMVEMLLAAEI